jgi:hypothetical protein
MMQTKRQAGHSHYGAGLQASGEGLRAVRPGMPLPLVGLVKTGPLGELFEQVHRRVQIQLGVAEQSCGPAC